MLQSRTGERYGALYRILKRQSPRFAGANVFDCYAIADGLEKVYKKYHFFEQAKYTFFEHIARAMYYHVNYVPRELEDKFWAEGRQRLERIYPQLENAAQNTPRGYAVYLDIMSLSPEDFRQKYRGTIW